MLYTPKVADYFQMLSDDEKKDFVGIIFRKYF